MIKSEVGSEGDEDDDGTVARARKSRLRSAEERGIVVNEVLANGSFGTWETFFDTW